MNAAPFEDLVIRSNRGLAYFLAFFWIISALLFAGCSIAAYAAHQFGTSFFLLAMCPVYLVLAGMEELANDIYINDDETFRFQVTYLFRNLQWIGRRKDIERICHQTYDSGDGDATDVFIGINGIGVVNLTGWDLQKAQDLGLEIGVRVVEETVASPTKSISRRELFDRKVTHIV